MLTGFSYLHYHQSNIQPGIIDPTCRLCGAAKEESQHLIQNCLGLADIRLTHLWQLELEDDTWYLTGLMNFLQSPCFERMENHTFLDEQHTRPAPWAGPPPQNAASRLPPCRYTSLRHVSQNQTGPAPRSNSLAQ
jgi:hypothetical protein